MSVLQGHFEVHVMTVPKEPCTQLVVLNTGGYHAQVPGTGPTEGGSVCTEKAAGDPCSGFTLLVR